MEDIIAYIILFSIGLGVLYLYQSRRLKPRSLPLTVQIYPECILKIFVFKQHGKAQTFICRIIAKKELEIKQVKLELIDKNRDFHNLHLSENSEAMAIPPIIHKNKYYDIKLPYQEFTEHIASQDKPFKTFRFVVENINGRKFKTHELAFHKNWSIYRPDTGKYN